MAYPPTLTDNQNLILTLLAEASNSTVADLRSGTGAAATVATPANMTLFWNQGAEEFCRTCYSLFDTSTYASLAASTRFVQFAPSTGGPTNASYYRLWQCSGATYAGVALTKMTRTAIETQFPTWFTDAASTPLYFYEQGIDGVGIYPPNSGSSSSLVLAGNALPTRLSSGSDVSPIAPDMQKVICWYAAAMICFLTPDPSLKGAGSQWWEMWRMYCEARLSQIWEADAMFAASTGFPRPGSMPAAPGPTTARASTDIE